MRNGVKFWRDIAKPLIIGKKSYLFKHKKEGFDEWNIYADNISRKEFAKRYDWFHGFWKARIVLPALNLLCYLRGPAKKNKVRDHRSHDAIMGAFSNAWDEALNDWVHHYQLSMMKDKLSLQQISKLIEERKETAAYRLLQQAKKLFFYVAMNDTAYKEFYNMLALRTAININKLTHKSVKQYPHLVYANTKGEINDVEYLVVSDALREAIKNGKNVTIKIKTEQ